MSARILDGTAVAGQIRSELSSRAAAFTRRAGRQPGLSIVLVGDKPDSQIYVNSKLKSAGDEGMKAALSHLPASTSLDEILSLIDKLNADPATDGILVQAPLPDSLGVSAMQKVFDAIDPSKDVDGVTPENVGRLVQNRADLIACTPAGIIELLQRSGVDIAGKHAVVIGRSEIVGKPVSMLLLHRHATVTVCHSRTKDLAGIAATGDILVAAIGRPGFVRAAFVRPGATVIDVGINLVTDAGIAREIFHEGHPRRGLFERKGSVLVGDVHPEVAEVAGAVTPVPGGVGPLTIAMLMANTIKAAELRLTAGR
jgi:methylenetetrahydrofolate dehydrogenase (NADP+) / methenyltetrahydrofolate cyclohydrolase